MQIVFEVFFFFFVVVFFSYLKTLLIYSPLNQSRNTTGIPLKNVNTYTSNEKYIQYSLGKRAKKKKKKKNQKTLYPEYRRFADFPKTLGIKPSTTLASPRKVRMCYAKLCEVTRNHNVVPGDNICREVMRNSSV